MALSLVQNTPPITPPPETELLSVSPFAAMRSAQATTQLHNLELEYRTKITKFDVELTAARLTLLPKARRLQEACDQANALTVGEDHPPLGSRGTLTAWVCIFVFELILGYLAMVALTI
jgi:hypothetical protein